MVEVFRALGCSVQSLAGMGAGVPDLLVGVAGLNLLVEVKDGTRPPSQRKLTPDQVRWHLSWFGAVSIVYNQADCEELVASARQLAAELADLRLKLAKPAQLQ